MEKCNKMVDHAIKPHPEQIIGLKGKEIELNPDTLRNILLQDAIKDKPVCVVSITGVFRQGKSFLLNFLIRYLNIKYKLKKTTEPGWLDSSDGPVLGFPYRGGSKRHTLGILMWSEVFLAELPSGKEVAIVLLDTQGSFDNVTSVTHCAAIFALSTLISSVQIYNLKENIKQYDLAHLECFSGYGQLLGNSEAPFQNLVLLIRDWHWPDENEFGEKGGQEMLEEIFNDPEGQSNEWISQKENIRELFKKISCFLLPYPGLKVASSKTFQGNLEDIDGTFKQHVEVFVASILAPENLIPKTVNGEAIKARDLFQFIETYCSCFQNGEMPSLQSMLTASSDAHHATALTESMMLYEQSMNFMKNKTSRSVDPHSLYGTHSQNKNKALQYFRQKKIIGNKEMKRNFERKLEEHLEEKFLEYKTLNEIKYEKEQELVRQIRSQQEQQFANEQLLNEQRRLNEEKLRQERIRREAEERKVRELLDRQGQPIPAIFA